jgi:DNA helicase IV
VTVLGDLAQATTPWAPGSWGATLAHLGHAAAIRPLTAGYRVPGEVLALANRLLPHIAPDVPPATSVRAGVGALRFAPRTALAAEVGRCLAAEGSIGVIVPDADVPGVVADLARYAARPLADDADARVTVLPASDAKGLEYDSVVLLDPAAIVDQEPTRLDGLRRLYVVMTRAVSRLIVVSDDPLPPEAE